jgi:hypothetical protein
MRRAARVGALTAALLMAASLADAAEFVVGSGGSVDLGTGSLDLGCADLTVAGTFAGGSVGFDQARDVTIAPTGIVNGEAATLQVAGDWDNAGAFNAGTGSVAMIDGCGLLSASVLGNTTFNDLDITTATAKLLSFEAGATTTVTGDLQLAGQSGALLQIGSTSGGVAALFDVQGSATTSFVDVADNDATAGNFIPLGDESLKGSNTPGWNLISAVPVVGLFGLVALGGSLLWRGRRTLAADGRG